MVEQEDEQKSPVVGYVLALIGAMIAIGLGIWITGSARPLWAIILLMWGLERVGESAKPIFRGMVLGVSYALIGVVVIYVRSARPLWAIILVNGLVDYIDQERKDRH